MTDVIEMRVADLIPYEKNPRRNEGAVDAVAESIRQFGFKVPIVCDKDLVIITGHTRLLAAIQLGLETVPVIVADDLTPDKVKAFRLADNKVGEFSIWDQEKLRKEMDELDGLFDMYDFGFELPRELPDREPGAPEDDDEEDGEGFVNRELDTEEFSEEQFKHKCGRCGFRWN